MAATETATDAAPAAGTIAAIDIGANAIRMAVAQVVDDGSIEVLERFQRAVRMGQDTFRRGRLGGQSMRAAVAVLRDFKQVLEFYNAETLRAVTTSAVREATNADSFVDRIFMATGINVEVISPSEESRLTVSAVLEAVGDALGVRQKRTLVADVGGGSTLLTVLEQGEIANYIGLRLGSIRLQEILATSDELPDRSVHLLRHHINSVVSSAQRSLAFKETRSFVATGGDARFAARQVGKPTASADLHTVSRSDFDDLVEQCERQTVEQLARKYALPFAEAETLVPALLIYQSLLHRTDAKQIIVSAVSMRDGLLLELARQVTGEEDEAVLEGVIHSAMALAEKYRVDMNHAAVVADLAVLFFDELQADHGLGKRHRLLLRVAGLIHEVGGFVSSLAHHKHSYYLTKNSEIFGLDREEIGMVAHIARYHRRSAPKPSHTEYMSMPRESRVIVNKLAAILRVADSLACGGSKWTPSIRFERQGDELVVHVKGEKDLTLQRRELGEKGDLFEDVYGMRIRLEEA
jgi:exopolyphosphatase/guanosine-5'-triphosphate,3'-diphosphate pyrophosphatase